MKYFKLIRSDLDTTAMNAEIASRNALWSANTSRQDHIPVQRHTQSIYLRSATRRDDLNVNDNQECAYTAVASQFPCILDFLKQFASEQDATLSRISIVRLSPNSQVFRHVDGGGYYLIRDRYHLVLRSKLGSPLASCDESVVMKEGELWWFDNKQPHESVNQSDDWRIHVIFDLLPQRHQHLAQNPRWEAPAGRTKAAQGAQHLETRKTELKEAIDREAILRPDSTPLIAPTGRSYSWMMDLRRILLKPKYLHAVAELFIQRLAAHGPVQVGAVEMAGIPLLTAVLMKSAGRGLITNGFIIRKERKRYGAGQIIEGTVTDAPIVVLEDLVNSGATLEYVRMVLEAQHHVLRRVITLVDFKRKQTAEWCKQYEIPVDSIFELADFSLPPRTEEPRVQRKPRFRTLWDFASPNPNYFARVPKSFPATDGNHVYFGSDCGTFWCLRAIDGHVQWKFEVHTNAHKNIWSAPALHEGRVHFGGYDGNVYCLDARSGGEIWRFEEADWIGSSPAIAPELGLLFIGLEHANRSKRGSIVALSLETGQKSWEHLTERYTHASPVYSRELNAVVCGSNDDELFLFNPKSGELRWRFETQSRDGAKGSIRHAAAIDCKRGLVVTGCANGYIYVIDADTGREVWCVKTLSSIYTVPLVLEGNAYVGSMDKHVYVLDLEKRRLRRKIPVGAKVLGPPRCFNGQVYFGTNSGHVYELDPETLEMSVCVQLPDAVTNAVAHNSRTGHFYVLTYANQLFALERIRDNGKEILGETHRTPPTGAAARRDTQALTVMSEGAVEA